MDCLSCGHEMANFTALTEQQQISYDMCEACGSLWLDEGELDKMAFKVKGSIEFSSQEEVEGASATSKHCPRCNGVELEKVRFLGGSDIVLDRCPNCGGFWLDGGELDLINGELERIMPVEGKGFSDFVNNVHLPYWYKRIRRSSAETDFTVPVPPIKGATRVGETGLKCPACETMLERYEAYGIRIEACPKCRGLWLYAEELSALKSRVTAGSWQSLRWMNAEMDAIEKAHAVPTRALVPGLLPDETAGHGLRGLGHHHRLVPLVPRPVARPPRIPGDPQPPARRPGPPLARGTEGQAGGGAEEAGALAGRHALGHCATPAPPSRRS